MKLVHLSWARLLHNTGAIITLNFTNFVCVWIVYKSCHLLLIILKRGKHFLESRYFPFWKLCRLVEIWVQPIWICKVKLYIDCLLLFIIMCKKYVLECIPLQSQAACDRWRKCKQWLRAFDISARIHMSNTEIIANVKTSEILLRVNILLSNRTNVFFFYLDLFKVKRTRKQLSAVLTNSSELGSW